MKASAKIKYATRIMLDLGLHASKENPRTFAEIAKAVHMSGKFVSTIAVQLKRAGLVNAVRGINGGLYLAKDPAKLPLLMTVEAVNGPIAIMPCLTPKPTCRKAKTCPVYDMWSDINGRIRDVLADYTLADVIAKVTGAKAPKSKTPARQQPPRASARKRA